MGRSAGGVVTPRDRMAALVDAHLAAEDVGDLDAAVAGYTEDVEHDVVVPRARPLHARRRRGSATEQLLRTCGRSSWSRSAVSTRRTSV